MPLPAYAAYVAGAAIGAAGGVAVEFVLSRGQADRGDYVVAGTVGALPGGLGAKGILNLGQKLSKLRYFSYSAGDRLATIGMGVVHPSSKMFLGSEIVGITSGVAAGYAVGQLHDHFTSRGGEHTSRSGTPRIAGTSTPDPSAQTKPGASRKKPGRRAPLADRRGPATSRERRPRTVRYRKGGCPPGYRYDRRRRMCVLTK